MKSLLVRLTSRKFLLTVAAFCTFAANKQYGAAIASVLGYHVVNGVISAYGD